MTAEGCRAAETPQADLRRGAIVALLGAIDPVDAREEASLAEVLTGVRELPAPFSQEAGPVHVTGSALILGPRGIVLHRHKRLGLWLQPGGHLDDGEWPHEGALREAGEETGLQVRHPRSGPVLLHVDAHDGGRGHRHLDLRYVLFCEDADPAPPPGESPDCRWFGWADAARITDPGLRGVLPKAQRVMID